MKTIRKRSFETNSSSVHSLTIDNSYEGKNSPDGAFVPLGNFGWEWKKYNSFEDKASYLWTLANMYNTEDSGGYFATNYPKEWEKMMNLKQVLPELAEKYNFILQQPDPTEKYHDFYVDHGSEHFVSWDWDFSTSQKVMEFLVNRNVWIMTGNDNDYGVPNCLYTPKQISDAKYFLKIGYADKWILDDLEPETIERVATTAFYYDDRQYSNTLSYEDRRERGDVRIDKIEIEERKIYAHFGTYDFKERKHVVLNEFVEEFEIIVKD